MNTTQAPAQTHMPSATRAGLYARCIDISKRVRWDIDRDVIRGRRFDFSKKFLPDGLSRVDRLEFLDAGEQRLLSQIQGRTYANLFGLAERFIGAKVMEVGREHALGDQTAMEALVRFADEELKHQELFRRVEAMTAAEMPEGYQFLADPNAVAGVVLGKSTWAVLALTCNIEFFTQAHYRASIEPDAGLSDLWKDVFLFHWREESQHAVLDELEWMREDAKLGPAERDRAVDDLIELVAAVDGILMDQAWADAGYFLSIAGRRFSPQEATRVRASVLGAYRWQFIGSGIEEPRFSAALNRVIDQNQAQRIAAALEPILQ